MLGSQDTGIASTPGPARNGMVLCFCALMAVLIGCLRYLTGPELAISIFYLVPVSVAAWQCGRRPGILIACLSALTWLLADLHMQDRFSSVMIPVVNEGLRLMVFLFVVFQLAAMRKVMESHRQTARTDPLTGIANRRSFLEQAQIEVSKSRRKNRPISLIFMDIDNFKTVNDTRGHHQGDILLSAVASTLTRAIRVTDLAARLGGDEFAVLLWRSDSEPAWQVARKINEQLLDLARRQHWPVTFSMGLVTYESVPPDAHEMIRSADRLMYQAKQQGKNGIVRQTVNAGQDQG